MKTAIALKGKAKYLPSKGFSVAGTIAGAPEGAKIRLRVIVGDGNVLASSEALVGTGDAARLYVKLTSKQKKAAKKVKTVKLAFDLLDAKGNVIATVRTAMVRPLG